MEPRNYESSTQPESFVGQRMFILGQACPWAIAILDAAIRNSEFITSAKVVLGSVSDISASPEQINKSVNNFAGYNKNTYPVNSTAEVINITSNDMTGMAEEARADLRLIFGLQQSQKSQTEEQGESNYVA